LRRVVAVAVYGAMEVALIQHLEINLEVEKLFTEWQEDLVVVLAQEMKFQLVVLLQLQLFQPALFITEMLLVVQ
jgi:hypothetical protein